MGVLDFTEIAEGNRSTGLQEQFELFARECLEMVGYEVEQGPDRGADHGRDLIVKERRIGIGGTSEIRWLVSCKHKAHSGKSVGVFDERDLRDRVEGNGCSAFFGFYSTVVSSGLTKKLCELGPHIEYKVFDAGRIEQQLLRSQSGIEIASRYFPTSFRKWRQYGFFRATLLLEQGTAPLTEDERRRIRRAIAEALQIEEEEVRITRVDGGPLA